MNQCTPCVGWRRRDRGGKALLNDFWYFSSPKSTRKEKLLYVSSRETTGLPYYPNPEFHQQPKEKLISLSAFFPFDEAGAKEKAIKKEKRRKNISRSAERDKNSAFLTAPPSPKGGRKLYCVRVMASFSVCTFLAFLYVGIDKNAQNRRISVSSPYNRTAETDFGERKSEYNKNAGNPRADFLPSLKPISVKV